MKLSAVRDYIAGLGITQKVYIGKLDAKENQSIGVYGRETSGMPNIPIGGIDLATYKVKPVSLLVHWNRSKNESEDTAYRLFETLVKADNLVIDNKPVAYVRLMTPEPQDVGTDEKGIYEYVIWVDFIYRKEQ